MLYICLGLFSLGYYIPLLAHVMIHKHILSNWIVLFNIVWHEKKRISYYIFSFLLFLVLEMEAVIVSN